MSVKGEFESHYVHGFFYDLGHSTDNAVSLTYNFIIRQKKTFNEQCLKNYSDVDVKLLWSLYHTVPQEPEGGGFFQKWSFKKLN